MGYYQKWTEPARTDTSISDNFVHCTRLRDHREYVSTFIIFVFLYMHCHPHVLLCIPCTTFATVYLPQIIHAVLFGTIYNNGQTPININPLRYSIFFFVTGRITIRSMCFNRFATQTRSPSSWLHRFLSSSPLNGKGGRGWLRCSPPSSRKQPNCPATS